MAEITQQQQKSEQRTIKERNEEELQQQIDDKQTRIIATTTTQQKMHLLRICVHNQLIDWNVNTRQICRLLQGFLFFHF